MKNKGQARARRFFSIKEVAEQTGLTAQQLRKWEQRYGVVHPCRLANGYRGYTSGDVARLQQMVRWVHAGVPAHMAARWLQDPPVLAGTRGAPDSTVADAPRWRQHIWKAGAAMKPDIVEREIRQAILHYGMRAVVAEIVRPVLIQVGEWWAEGIWLPDQEQITSEACRRVLLNGLADLTPLRRAPRVLCAAAPGDRHDLPAVLTAIEAALYGWDARVLGPSPAPGAIERAVLKWGPVWLVVIATTSPKDNPELRQFVKTEAPRLPRWTTVYGGGLGWPAREISDLIRLERPEDLFARIGSPPAI